MAQQPAADADKIKKQKKTEGGHKVALSFFSTFAENLRTVNIINFAESNSIINQYVAELRDVNIQGDRGTFRYNLQRIGQLMAYEVSKTLRYSEKTIQTPLAQSKANTARIKQLDSMITFAEHIRRIQPIIDEMNAIHWKGRREKFRAAHQQEIDLYYTSQRILKEKHGVKKIDISGRKKEQAALRHEEEERTAQYKSLREKLDQMLNVKYWVETARHEEIKKQKAKKRGQQALE